jgi:hypothetical protein
VPLPRVETWNPIWVQSLRIAVEQIGDDELKGELKKINKQLKKMMDLKKQPNMMAGVFYSCIIALFFLFFAAEIVVWYC